MERIDSFNFVFFDRNRRMPLSALHWCPSTGESYLTISLTAKETNRCRLAPLGGRKMAFGELPKPANHNYGLRNDALSPVETLAQSISCVCPTLTPVFTLPLAFALAGNSTWLAYLFATGGTLLVAWCISCFARHCSSPGSLYAYAEIVLPPWLSTVLGWSLLMAYLGGSASSIGGFYYYTNMLLRIAGLREISALLLSAIVAGVPVWLAWRSVKVSARVMLAIEATSVTVVCCVLALVL
jgi:amino acid transporter